MLTARQAGRAVVDTLVAEGDLDDAASFANGARLDPEVASGVRAPYVRRRWAHRLAIARPRRGRRPRRHLALARAARRGALVRARAATRSFAPIAFLFAAWIAIAGGALAAAYEAGNAAPFIALGAAVLPLALLARAWNAAGDPTPSARGTRAALCGSTVLAAALLLLEWINPTYLTGFGL